MNALLWTIGSLALAWVLHVAIWRTKLPKRQTQTLLWVFFITFIFCVLVNITLIIFQVKNIFLDSVPDFIAFALGFWAATLSYVITYSAVEVDSPSLLIIDLITNRNGTDIDSIYDILGDNVLLKPRIEDLVRDGHLKKEKSYYTITGKGKKFIDVFIGYRAILFAKKGG